MRDSPEPDGTLRRPHRQLTSYRPANVNSRRLAFSGFTRSPPNLVASVNLVARIISTSLETATANTLDLIYIARAHRWQFKRSTSFLGKFSDAGSRWLHSGNFLSSQTYESRFIIRRSRYGTSRLNFRSKFPPPFASEIFAVSIIEEFRRILGFGGTQKPVCPGFENPRFWCTGTAPNLGFLCTRNPPDFPVWRSPQNRGFPKNPKNPVFGGQTGYLNNR